MDCKLSYITYIIRNLLYNWLFNCELDMSVHFSLFMQKCQHFFGLISLFKMLTNMLASTDGCLRLKIQHEPIQPDPITDLTPDPWPDSTRPPTPFPENSTTTFMEQSTTTFSHKQECESAEIEQTRCLNGGTCFAIILNNGSRGIGCRLAYDHSWHHTDGTQVLITFLMYSCCLYHRYSNVL